ncbi:MAG: hypothetical protein R3E84_20790 [Pseudomonadales bacterium]
MTNASMSAPHVSLGVAWLLAHIARDAGPETPIVVISPIFQAPLAPAVCEFPPASSVQAPASTLENERLRRTPGNLNRSEGRKLTSPIIADLIHPSDGFHRPATQAGDTTLRFLDGFISCSDPKKAGSTNW